MAIILNEDAPFRTTRNTKRVKYINDPDVKNVKKTCPWALMTVPHKEGHMAFETVAGYTEWAKNKS